MQLPAQWNNSKTLKTFIKQPPFYLPCPLPLLIIYSLLCLCVCVFLILCVCIYSSLSDLMCERSVIEKVAQSALGRSCYCHNVKLFAEVGDCLQPSVCGDGVSPATTKRVAIKHLLSSLSLPPGLFVLTQWRWWRSGGYAEIKETVWQTFAKTKI